jgi:hypothetical protein
MATVEEHAAVIAPMIAANYHPAIWEYAAGLIVEQYAAGLAALFPHSSSATREEHMAKFAKALHAAVAKIHDGSSTAVH